MSRIPPLPVDEWSTEITDFFAGFRSSVASDSDDRPKGANLLGTLARYPGLAKPFITFNQHLLAGSSLSIRHREIMILRVANRRNCAYEYAQHVLLARSAGVTDSEIDDIALGSAATGWSPFESALLDATDELLNNGIITDGTWKVLSTEFDDKQFMDVVFTVGTYAMVAMALRSFGVELDDDLLSHFDEGEIRLGA
ncbi:UNVERIFIED_CONTAM: alkylhydroperoxidase family enzyme [Williamsia faeni]